MDEAHAVSIKIHIYCFHGVNRQAVCCDDDKSVAIIRKMSSVWTGATGLQYTHHNKNNCNYETPITCFPAPSISFMCTASSLQVCVLFRHVRGMQAYSPSRLQRRRRRPSRVQLVQDSASGWSRWHCGLASRLPWYEGTRIFGI